MPDELYLRSELVRWAMEGLRLRGIPWAITRLAPTRWEIRVGPAAAVVDSAAAGTPRTAGAVMPVGSDGAGGPAASAAVIRPSPRKDGINIFRPGRSRAVFLPDPLVRGRPWVVGEEVLRDTGF